MTIETETTSPAAELVAAAIRAEIACARESSDRLASIRTGHPFASWGLANAAGRARALVSDLEAALTWLTRPDDVESEVSQ